MIILENFNYFDLIPDRILHSRLTVEYDESEVNECGIHLVAKETGPYEFLFRLEKEGTKFRAYYAHEGFEGVDYILPISPEVYQEALDNNTVPFWIIEDLDVFNTPEEAVKNLYEWLEEEIKNNRAWLIDEKEKRD